MRKFKVGDRVLVNAGAPQEAVIVEDITAEFADSWNPDVKRFRLDRIIYSSDGTAWSDRFAETWLIPVPSQQLSLFEDSAPR